MEEAAVHLVQRLLSLRETRVPGRSKHRVEEFQRRVSVVRRSAASDLVQRLPQTPVLPFPLHQVFVPFRSSNPSDLVQRLPQTLVPSFPLHQVFGPFRSSNPSDLVHESPQNLVSSFPLHQVFGVQFSVYDVTWCFAPRNPLFLRLEAPRPQVRMGLCRHGRGASLPAIPYSFVEGHHVPGPRWDWRRKCGRICHSTALPSTSVLYRQKK